MNLNILFKGMYMFLALIAYSLLKNKKSWNSNNGTGRVHQEFRNEK
jgi:hypothetical protein